MNHNVLLAFYCMACFFETQLSNPLVPRDALENITQIKQEIEHRFTQLAKAHGGSLKNIQSSHNGALQQLTPELRAKEQFKTNLASIKEREARIERMMQLRQILSESPKNAMDVFWAHYQTQEQFNQLMDDLEIKSDQRKHWQPFFNAKHGDLSRKLTGGLSIILPNVIGGTPSDVFSINMLIRENCFALNKLKVQLIEYKNPTKLIAEIETEFSQLKDIEKKISKL